MAEKGNLHLRDYQKDIVTRVYQEWEHHRSVMVQMPTGTGKTHVLASIVNEECRMKNEDSSTILIVAHRMELVEQIRETVDVFKSFATLRMTQHVIVSSIQTISRRLGSLDFKPDLVIIDEAHHALARTYRMMWDKWPEAKFLGLTATPCRMNHAGFTDLFDKLVMSWNMAEFIRKGILTAFDYVSIRPESVDQQLINSLQKRGADGDYQVKEMDAVLNKQPSIERLYRSVKEFADEKKGIVYAISIDHARKIAEYYNEQGVKTAAIDSKTPKEERRRLVEDFKNGNIQMIVNVDVFSEGFDCPDVEFIQMARPTLSLAKYLQQVGRGLRKSEGKETCLLIDNVGLYRVFGLPIQAWDWKRMFQGNLTGKGLYKESSVKYADNSVTSPIETEQEDIDVELVISHDALLTRLHELDKRPATRTFQTTELKAWQDMETGLWGLRLGREKRTEAEYVTVFDIQKELAAVRFQSHACGLVDTTGKILWKQRNCQSMKFSRKHFLIITTNENKKNYLDLYSMKTYEWKPEIKRYGTFELLKVRHQCYSRTRKTFTCNTDYDSLLIVKKDFYLSIYEYPKNIFCILEGDNEECYTLFRKMEDGSLVISDRKGNFYHATKDKEKVYIGNRSSTIEWEKCLKKIEQLNKDIPKQLQAWEENKKREIQAEHFKAIPYQSGLKWGLKVGNRITIPPIYRNVRQPIGKYCAVEKNYNQWGIFSIDGTVLVEPNYPEVTIEKDGNALLTQVTGKKVRVVLK